MTSEDSNYVAELEATLKKFMTPIEGVPLRVVVRSLTGHDVLPWHDSDPACKTLKIPLVAGISKAARQLAREGVESRRPNEVGNYVERPVLNALREEGFQAGIPDVARGGRQSAGYPDILLTFGKSPPIYLEVKTYNLDNVSTTQRSFYLSPPLAKVTRDAFHLLLAFETKKRAERFFPSKYRLLSIDGLPLDLKHEFNQNNRILYSSCPTVAEGSALPRIDE